jgi:hypothetical protein
VGKNNQDPDSGESIETIFCDKLFEFFAADPEFFCTGSGIRDEKKSDTATCTDTCALPASTTL